jgi:hypothetical protein
LPPWARLGPLDTGFHACIHLPPDVSDRDVVKAMREGGVLAISLSSGCIDPAHGNGLVIGFGAFDALTIDRSVAVIGRALRKHDSLSRAARALPPAPSGATALPAEGKVRPSAGLAAPGLTIHQRAGEKR